MLVHFKRIASEHVDTCILESQKIARAFAHYTLSSETPLSLRFSLYYPQLQKLTGEIHLDANLLLGIETFIKVLKRNHLVQNQDTPVTSTLPYNRFFLKENLQDDVSNIPSISKIELYPDHIDLTITGSHPGHFISNLDSFMTSLELTKKSFAPQPVSKRAHL